METLNQLEKLSNERHERARKISDMILRAESSMKNACGRFSLLFIYKSIPTYYNDCVIHHCIAWDHANKHHRLEYIEYETPNEPYSFDLKEVLLRKNLGETKAIIRFDVEPYLEEFFAKVVELIKLDQEFCYVVSAQENNNMVANTLLPLPCE